MSSKDKTTSSTATTNSPKARQRDKAQAARKNLTTSKYPQQSTSSGSQKVNQQTSNNNKTSNGGGGSSINKSRSSNSKRRLSKQEEAKKSSTESDEARELVQTTGSNGHEGNPNSDAMNRANILEQETNVDGSDFLGPTRRVSFEEEKDGSDENSCLLSSESTQSDRATVRLTQSNIKKTATKNDDDDDLKHIQESSDISNNNPPPLPNGWEQHSDKLGLYYWHVSTGIIQRNRPTSELQPREAPVLVCHDDEEINQVTPTKTSESDDDDDYYESGAALTLDDTSETTFVVYPLGCCEFDETQLVSANSTKTIQKCILRLCNMPTAEESVCWGLDQSQPILMKLHPDHIQFTDLKTRNLLRSQPINTIKTWAVDDDNNFAFVIEDKAAAQQPNSPSSMDPYESSLDYALLSEPRMMCYVFRSIDDDDMSCKVSAKLNEEINRCKEQLAIRVAKSAQMQRMIEPLVTDAAATAHDQLTDAEEDFECLETSNELTLPIKYIGSTPVPRPTGIDVLNVAIDKCLAEATNKAAQDRNGDLEAASVSASAIAEHELNSTLIDAKLHVSPSSVIVENCSNGEIIVECRIRYLTFMGISRRDIRWAGFIMQNPTSKVFVAYCFESHPTAGPVCDAIQQSCTKMYEKVVKNSRRPQETKSIIPSKMRIRNTLAKTFARIKLNPIAD